MGIIFKRNDFVKLIYQYRREKGDQDVSQTVRNTTKMVQEGIKYEVQPANKPFFLALRDLLCLLPVANIFLKLAKSSVLQFYFCYIITIK